MLTECRVCGYSYISSDPNNIDLHNKRHAKMAQGELPIEVREFIKDFGWAVAHNDGGLGRLKDRHKQELGKQVILYTWWNRARANGVSVEDFDNFMEAHLVLIDAQVENNPLKIETAQKAILKWDRFDG